MYETELLFLCGLLKVFFLYIKAESLFKIYAVQLITCLCEGPAEEYEEIKAHHLNQEE